ncbi:MAG: cyanophycinase [Marinilabiliales bacterium]|nr:cyanophycinase [Marinilabiliales bacterium]
MEEEREQETRHPPDHGPGRRRPDGLCPEGAGPGGRRQAQRLSVHRRRRRPRRAPDAPVRRAGQARRSGQDRRLHHGQQRAPRDRARARGRVQGLRRHRRRLLPPDARGGPGPGQPQDPRRCHRRLVLRRRPGQADGGPVGHPLHKRMLELYKEGCLIGGTSAGAAVMSEFMITGNEKRAGGEEGSWEVILADDVEHTEGFGFVTGAVIDQHFVTRKRHNRLISVVLENPALVGVGIEESTAVLVRPDGLYEVLGEGQVVVYDARRAATRRSADGHLGGHGLTLHVLLAGDVYDLASGRVVEPAK